MYVYMYQLFNFEFIEMIVFWCLEDVNVEVMLLFCIFVGIVVKINVIDFFRIVFSISVGYSVFKCFKDE